MLRRVFCLKKSELFYLNGNHFYRLAVVSEMSRFQSKNIFQLSQMRNSKGWF